MKSSLKIIILTAGILFSSVCWEAYGMDGDLSVVPSDILRAVHDFLCEWAYWFGNIFYEIVKYIYDHLSTMLKRFWRAAENLFWEIFLFIEVPYAFLCGCVNGTIKYISSLVYIDELKTGVFVVGITVFVIIGIWVCENNTRPKKFTDEDKSKTQHAGHEKRERAKRLQNN